MGKKQTMGCKLCAYCWMPFDFALTLKRRPDYCGKACKNKAKARRDRIKRKAARATRPVFCDRCKEKIENPGTYQKYCDACRPIAYRENRNATRAKKRGANTNPPKPRAKERFYRAHKEAKPFFECPFASGQVQVCADGGLTVRGADASPLERTG